MFVEETLYQTHRSTVTVLTRMTNSHRRPGTFCVAAGYHVSNILSCRVFKRERKLICCYFCFCTQTHVSVKEKRRGQGQWLFTNLQVRLKLLKYSSRQVSLGPQSSTPTSLFTSAGHPASQTAKEEECGDPKRHGPEHLIGL